MALPAYRALDSSEALPSYRCTINLQGRLLCKRELHKPATAAGRSRWECVDGKLQGTSLVFEFIPIRQHHGREHHSTLSRTRAYTLQLADAGLAVDSKDRVRVFSKDGANAFRLRVEGEQLLCVAPTAEMAAIWVEQILAAVAISVPLDERAMVKYPCTPPKRLKALEMWDQGLSGMWLWTKWSAQARLQLEWLMAVSEGIPNEGWNQKKEIEKEYMPRHTAKAQTKVQERWLADTITSDPDSASQESNPRAAGLQCPCSSCHTPDSFRATQSRNPTESPPATRDLDREPVRSALDNPRRWVRILTISSAWRDDCYIRDGRKVQIARRTLLNVPLY